MRGELNRMRLIAYATQVRITVMFSFFKNVFESILIVTKMKIQGSGCGESCSVTGKRMGVLPKFPPKYFS